MHLDDIGNHPSYKIDFPVKNDQYKKLRNFLGVTNDWLAEYELKSQFGEEIIIANEIWSLTKGQKFAMRVCDANTIALGIILAECHAFAEFKWLPVLDRVYFVGVNWQGVSPALQYVIKLNPSHRALLPPEYLRLAPMNLFSGNNGRDLSEQWLQKYPEAVNIAK